jgi:transposase
MQAIVEKCCGLDVHQATVVACLLVGSGPGRKTKKAVRSFSTMTYGLRALRDWLKSEGCTHVAMESTGVYWKPVYRVLEGSFELIVGNAQHIKNVPGRKTDVKDSEWIARLVQCGLIAKSFVPPKPIRELRDLLRYRRKLVEAGVSERNRLMKVLELANIKLSTVASDVFGVSGRQMIRALIDGEQPFAIAQLAKGRLRQKLHELVLALDGNLEEHHRCMLKIQLARVEAIESDLAQFQRIIDEKLAPYGRVIELLVQIPGVDRSVAATIIAEIGVDMTVFNGDAHLASWAGLCPGNYESAGRRMGGKTRRGNVHLRTALVGAAVAAGRTKGTYLRDKYHRLRAKRGPMRAAVAIAHKILLSAYHMIKDQADYKDLGEAYLDDRDHRKVTNNLVRRLQRLGYDVTLTAAPEISAA